MSSGTVLLSWDRSSPTVNAVYVDLLSCASRMVSVGKLVRDPFGRGDKHPCRHGVALQC